MKCKEFQGEKTKKTLRSIFEGYKSPRSNISIAAF